MYVFCKEKDVVSEIVELCQTNCKWKLKQKQPKKSKVWGLECSVMIPISGTGQSTQKFIDFCSILWKVRMEQRTVYVLNKIQIELKM